MIQVAIIFGMRVALFLFACAVVYAFFRPTVAWANSDCNDPRANTDRLAAGVCMLALGSIFNGTNQMIGLLFGQNVVEHYVSAVMVALVGLSLLLGGYFLCFTAWLSNRRAIPVRRVTIWCFAGAVTVSALGVGLFYALTG